mmetsp:Transcript_24462/g.60904  ORF Transcript_24462/g.60904 Transcript_24462/m.60904 type:complete len:369 (-) Transcript_24462:2194-3300(-)
MTAEATAAGSSDTAVQPAGDMARRQFTTPASAPAPRSNPERTACRWPSRHGGARGCPVCDSREYDEAACGMESPLRVMATTPPPSAGAAEGITASTLASRRYHRLATPRAAASPRLPYMRTGSKEMPSLPPPRHRASPASMATAAMPSAAAVVTHSTADDPLTARPATLPTLPNTHPRTPAPPRSVAADASKFVATTVTTVPPLAELAGGLTPKISMPPGSQRKPTGPAGPREDSAAVGGESHADAGPLALLVVCTSMGGSHLTMAPDTITASDAATSDPAADPEPPAMVTWHHRGASPSIATAPPLSLVSLASMYMVIGRFPPASAEAGAETSRTAAARPFLSSVASPPSPGSTHDTRCVRHGSAAL